MKRLLLAPFLFLLAGCQSNPTQWPTSWSQFDFECILAESKSFLIVVITISIHLTSQKQYLIIQGDL